MSAMPGPKVCYFNNPRYTGDFHGYQISTLDPAPYFFQGTRWRLSARLKFRALFNAAGLDTLYRERDPAYMRYVRDFVAAYHDADILVMATYNPIHPEILYRELAAPTKILGFIDDPYSTYVRGIPYLWAFDGAFYISPAYNDAHRFAEALRAWGCEAAYWFPLVVSEHPPAQPTDSFFRDRDVDVVYVGGGYGPKIDRLRHLKSRLGARLRVHGRWRFRGHVGWMRGLLGKPVFPYRVAPLSDGERRELYFRTKIGINMHLSETPTESGNMRMYEVPAHGAMLLCDKGALNAHELIFKPGVEAVFYDDVTDALERIEYYLAHTEERLAIARAGFERAQSDYGAHATLKGMLDWASHIQRRPRPLPSATRNGE